ncbi:hypothetical protein GCM10025857_17300 [Alicyclobacillus contaminans]|nr:hypothetical protein GCM10025857_17300 [Alicyclobacillus contaminans]
MFGSLLPRHAGAGPALEHALDLVFLLGTVSVGGALVAVLWMGSDRLIRTRA